MARFAPSFKRKDLYWPNVSLVAAYEPDKTNGSTVFSSIGNRLFTTVGTAQWDTADFPTGLTSSGLFDGSGDRLTIPDNVNFEFGTGNFTIELFVKAADSGVSRTVICKSNSGTSHGPWLIQRNSANEWQVYLSSAGAGWDITSGLVMGTTGASGGSWVHLALVRDGTTFRTFVNGVAGATVTSSSTVVDNAENVCIGALQAFGQDFNGWIASVRLTKGVARYTGAFTPPLIPFPTNNVDDTSWDSVVLLALNENGYDGSTIFLNKTSSLLTAVGNTAWSNVSPPTGMATAPVFDGSGDYISVPDNTALDLGLNKQPFTIDGFVKFDNAGSVVDALLGKGGGAAGWNGTNGHQYTLFKNSDGSFYFQWYDGDASPSQITFSNAAFTSGIWHHVAITFDGNTTRIYVDGVHKGSSTANSYLKPATSNIFYFGAIASLGANEELAGGLSSWRITRGVARWIGTGSFTAPVAPRALLGGDPYFPQVSCLVGNDKKADASVIFNDQSLNNFVVTAAGTAQWDTAQFPAGLEASVLLDGDSDYLTLPDSEAWNFAAGDFTLECFVRFNSAAGDQTFISQWNSGTAILFDLNSGNTLRFLTSDSGGTQQNVTGSWTPSTGTWYHVAATREGTTGRIFVDGSQINSGSITHTLRNSTELLQIGAVNQAPTLNYLNGWIAGVRITKGFARYHSTFTPPGLPLGVDDDGRKLRSFAIGVGAAVLTGAAPTLAIA